MSRQTRNDHLGEAATAVTNRKPKSSSPESDPSRFLRASFTHTRRLEAGKQVQYSNRYLLFVSWFSCAAKIHKSHQKCTTNLLSPRSRVWKQSSTNSKPKSDPPKSDSQRFLDGITKTRRGNQVHQLIPLCSNAYAETLFVSRFSWAVKIYKSHKNAQQTFEVLEVECGSDPLGEAASSGSNSKSSVDAPKISS